MKKIKLLLIFLSLNYNLFPQNLDLTFTENQLLNYNYELQISKNNNQIAEIEENIAKSLNYPSLDFFMQYHYFDEPPGMKFSLIPGFPEQKKSVYRNDNWDIGLELKYLLYSGGKISNIYEISKHSKELSYLLWEDKKRNLLFINKKYYVQALLLKEIYQLSYENFKHSEQKEKDLRNRYQLGAVSKLEYLKSNTNKANAEALLNEAKLNYEAFIKNYLLFLSLDKDFPSINSIKLKGNLYEIGEFILNYDSKIYNIDTKLFKYKILNKQKFISKLKQQQVESKEYPEIYGGVKYDYSNPYLGKNYFGSNIEIFLQLRYPLWDYNKTKNELEKAKIIHKNELLQIENLEKELKQYYKILIERIEQQKIHIYSKKEQLKNTKELYNASDVAYKQGVISYQDLLDTELMYLKVKLEYLESISQYLTYVAEWEFLTMNDAKIFNFFRGE
jgi:outer membrane protein TolC